MEAWLGTLDNGFAQAMDLIRAQGSMEIEMATLSEKDKERSQLLFGILSGLLHERGKRLLRSIKDRNGYEAYRALLVDLLPGNRSRMLALLQLINQWPGFDGKQGFAQQMMKLESAFNEYDTQSPQPLSDDIKIACLLRCVSGQLKQHLNVAVTDKTKYADLRALVLRWDKRHFPSRGVRFTTGRPWLKCSESRIRCHTEYCFCFKCQNHGFRPSHKPQLVQVLGVLEPGPATSHCFLVQVRGIKESGPDWFLVQVLRILDSTPATSFWFLGSSAPGPRKTLTLLVF